MSLLAASQWPWRQGYTASNKHRRVLAPMRPLWELPEHNTGEACQVPDPTWPGLLFFCFDLGKWDQLACSDSKIWVHILTQPNLFAWAAELCRSRITPMKLNLPSQHRRASVCKEGRFKKKRQENSVSINEHSFQGVTRAWESWAELNYQRPWPQTPRVFLELWGIVFPSHLWGLFKVYFRNMILNTRRKACRKKDVTATRCDYK